MTLFRALTVVLVAAMAVVVSPATAGADCMGPTIERTTGSVDRDGTVHVVGKFWGDNCYDTGPPPDGQGALGLPVSDIEVYLVQNGVEHLVATGDADQDLGFTVHVPVPDDLKPGPIEVIARSAMDVHTFVETTEPLVVSVAAPTGESNDAPVAFDGPAQAQASTTTTAPPPLSETPTPKDEVDEGGFAPTVVAGGRNSRCRSRRSRGVHRSPPSSLIKTDHRLI